MRVAMWKPRGDEHALAASLGMCERDPKVHDDLIARATEQTTRDHPGVCVSVHRWHIWRVVRAMVRLKVSNTPDGRAAAYAWLATHPNEGELGDEA